MKSIYFILLFPIFLYSQFFSDQDSVVDRFEEFEGIYDQKTKAEDLEDCRLDMNYYIVFNRYGEIVFTDSVETDKFITYPAKDCYAKEFNTVQAYNNFIKMLELRAYPHNLIKNQDSTEVKDKIKR